MDGDYVLLDSQEFRWIVEHICGPKLEVKGKRFCDFSLLTSSLRLQLPLRSDENRDLSHLNGKCLYPSPATVPGAAPDLLPLFEVLKTYRQLGQTSLVRGGFAQTSPGKRSFFVTHGVSRWEIHSLTLNVYVFGFSTEN